VVNPGVDMDAFTPGEFDTYFLYPSRFRRYKRQHLAIEAFRAADIDDFKLVLAGSAQEQDYVDELRDMAADEDNIAIKTDVAGEEWTELFENAYSILFLAENEDWGIVPLEGMAAGKPVIAVNEGGYTEAVDDEATGFLVDADPDAIAEAMWTLVEDADMAQTMGDAGRERVQQYTWARFIDQFQPDRVGVNVVAASVGHPGNTSVDRRYSPPAGRRCLPSPAMSSVMPASHVPASIRMQSFANLAGVVSRPVSWPDSGENRMRPLATEYDGREPVPAGAGRIRSDSTRPERGRTEREGRIVPARVAAPRNFRRYGTNAGVP